VRHIGAGGQGRAADGPQIEIELETRVDAERVGDAPRGVELTHMPLPVVNREHTESKAISLGDRRGRVGIKAAAQEDNGAHSDAARRGRPDVLVELHLQTCRDVLGEHPVRQRSRMEYAVNR